jgi:hypothetical protein
MTEAPPNPAPRPAHLPVNLAWALLQLSAGLLLGLVLLEAVLQVNPHLLLRGMGAPSPIDSPLTTENYAVHLSDADLFFWHSALIRPIPAADDDLEATVRFTTDEFGFPNPAPSLPHTDVIVLGRSFSLGAQAEAPWPALVAQSTGLQVTNFSQAASSIEAKRGYLTRFGAARHPGWVILEVLPSMDLLGYAPPAPNLVSQLPVPLLQALARWLVPAALPPALAAPIYPLPVGLQQRTADVVFFSYYLSALTVDEPSLEASQQWASYQAQVLALVAEARASGACVALLYAPTKEEVYVPLAADPRQLAPILQAGWAAWELQADGVLRHNPKLAPRVEDLQANAGAARRLLRTFAAAHALPFIDPSDAMQAAAGSGPDPFMRYDSHWSASGHALVAEQVAETLRRTPCP